MKATINHSRNYIVCKCIFFGISASIFVLSIFFSLYQKSGESYFSKGMSTMMSSRIVKPISAHITETMPVNLKAMLTDDELPMVIESWMTEPYNPAVNQKSQAAADAKVFSITYPAEYSEAGLVVEPWMTSTDAWSIIALNTEFEEPVLRLESWMLNADEWLLLSVMSPFFNAESFVEERLYIEEWMLDLSSWAIGNQYSVFSIQ